MLRPGFAGGAEEDKKALERSCRAPRQAYDSCVRANRGDVRLCGQLETRLVECLAEKLCPAEVDKFHTCVMTSFSDENKEWLPSACDTEVHAMQKCLKKIKMFPFKMSQSR